MVNVEKYGNTSAASIPVALDEAKRQGRIHKGDIVLLNAFGAGFAWGGGGGAILAHPKLDPVHCLFRKNYCRRVTCCSTFAQCSRNLTLCSTR